MIRLAHFSDIHVSALTNEWQPRDWFSKRLTGWINLRFLGRGARFQYADQVLTVLRREFREREFDQLVFSGDAGMIAFDAEFAKAADALGVNDPSQPPGIAVPGNHDHYVNGVVKRDRFEHFFAPWLVGERVDSSHHYPFARRVGHIWLIGLNSSRANFGNWDASGEVGFAQRRRLAELLAQLEPGPRILVTHYPAVMGNGEPEPIFHRLRDWDDVVKVATAGGVGLWLCGHRHSGYVRMPMDNIPFPLICAGSATQMNRWSYNEYQIEGNHLTMIRRQFDLDRNVFAETETREIELPFADHAASTK